MFFVFLFCLCVRHRAPTCETHSGRLSCVEMVGCAPQGSLSRRFPALADDLDTGGLERSPRAQQRPGARYQIATETSGRPFTDRHNEAKIRRSLRGRPAGAGLRPSSRCHAQDSCRRTKRARRDQRADRLQPLERERERGGVFTASELLFYNCSDRRRRRRSRPSAPRRCTPRSRRTSTSARRAPRRSRTTSPSSRASSAARTLMRGLLTRQPTPPWPRPPLRRAGPDAASQKSRPYATPPSLR